MLNFGAKELYIFCIKNKYFSYAGKDESGNNNT